MKKNDECAKPVNYSVYMVDIKMSHCLLQTGFYLDVVKVMTRLFQLLFVGHHNKNVVG